MSLMTHGEVERLRQLSSRLREVTEPERELREIASLIVAFCTDFFEPQFVDAHEARGELSPGDAFGLAQFCYAALLAAKFVELAPNVADVRSHVNPWLHFTPGELDELTQRLEPVPGKNDE